MYVNSRLKAIQIIGKRKGREFQSLAVLRNNNRKTIQIYQNNEKTSFENKEVESFAPVHINICQSHNQLIVWFASAAHSNLDSKNLTFLGLKNDVQITAVMYNFLLKPRSRNLFKCFFFILRHIQRIHRKHFQNFQMFILQYNSQFPDPPKVFLELAKETWKIHHTTTDTTNPMLDLEQYNQIRSHNGTLL